MNARRGGQTTSLPVRQDSGATIQSVERAAELLTFFTPTRPRLSLLEITSRLGVSKATGHRYVMVLRRLNLLRYDRATGEYTLGPQILTLAASVRAGLPILNLAEPLMEQLVREVDETVVLSVWDGEAPVVVRVNDSTDRIVQVSVRTGARLAPRDSAQGRIFCAYLPAGEVPDLEADLNRDPRLARELAQMRKTGVAVNSPKIHGVRTVATPVFEDGTVVAVLAVVGTTVSVPSDVDSPVAKALKRTASKLAHLLGEHDRLSDDTAAIG